MSKAQKKPAPLAVPESSGPGVQISIRIAEELYERVKQYAQAEYAPLAREGYPLQELVEFAFMRVCELGFREVGLSAKEMPHWMEQHEERRREPKIIAFPGVV